MGHRNTHALPAALLADYGKHRRLFPIDQIHLIAGLLLALQIKGGKACLLSQLHGGRHRLALGFRTV